MTEWTSFFLGFLVGSFVATIAHLACSHYEHREWCRMFDRLFNIVDKLRQQISKDVR